jgi:tRNA modification GTPase
MLVFQGEETIAAISTGLGEAGIGVIRISGVDALEVATRAFRPRQGAPLSDRQTHTVTYGWVIGPGERVVDEALALVMRGPHSFTGEDVVEIQCHGGQVAVRRVLDAALTAGARLADPGEFSRRAFLNGRMDLSQAEAVIDIIRAKTDLAMDAAVNQLQGGFGDAIRVIRDRLVEMSAHLEADIDFPELNLAVQTLDQVVSGCVWSLARVDDLLAGSRQGKLLREGFRVVLAGRPNVGKSSLLNRLVRENRAIVTAVPGTTRDVIEEWVNLRGIPVVLADTAGIRETSDLIEQMGVDRSRSMIERADLVLVVYDASVGLTAEDWAVLGALPANVEHQLLANKIDITVDEIGPDALGVSALSGVGLEELEERIARAAGLADKEESFLANARQTEALGRARALLASALETSRAGFGSDLLSIDIRGAWVTLGELTGESVGEDLLDQIFSRFCIGK